VIGSAILILLSLVSCNHTEAQGVRSHSTHIDLYTRPSGFTEGTTHSRDDIDSVLEEQEGYIGSFETIFEVEQKERISIYLYDPEEDPAVIGVSKWGGHVDPESRSLHYRFFQPVIGTNGKLEVLGGHEICHLLAITSWGQSYTRLISEGLATWFGDSYGIETIDGKTYRKSPLTWMKGYQSSELFLPSELVSEPIRHG
jgi:hypothetical protein